MAAFITGASRATRGSRANRRRPMSEINVTPFVDVMLVLLIVFMVTAPLLTVGVPVDLPQTRAKSLGEDREPLAVSVDASGQVFLQNTPIPIEELVPKLMAISNNGYNQRVFVRGDRNVAYGKVAEVMGLLNAAGFTRIGLVNETARQRLEQ
jgi:biopolymer transport protein TolR